MQNKEKKFLNIITKTLSKNSHLGDDCAYLPDFGIVVTQDSLVENVHFELKSFGAKKLGQKAVLVNISDVLASGAKPKYLTIALCGNLDESFIKEFYLGANEICDEFDTEVIGGDLTSGEKITISICAIGDASGRKISSRSNAEIGYIVAACGIFGENAVADYTLVPKLYPGVSKAIAKSSKFPYALMDSSDGLYDCLNQISNASGVKICINYEKIPKHPDADFNLTLFGGEDYCLVGCFAQDDYDKFEIKDKMIKIGVVEKGNGVFVDGIKINEDLSYDHFGS